jgi:hypothetical protein
VDYETGHGDSVNELKIYDDWANIFSVAFLQTGFHNHQLK